MQRFVQAFSAFCIFILCLPGGRAARERGTRLPVPCNTSASIILDEKLLSEKA